MKIKATETDGTTATVADTARASAGMWNTKRAPSLLLGARPSPQPQMPPTTCATLPPRSASLSRRYKLTHPTASRRPAASG